MQATVLEQRDQHAARGTDGVESRALSRKQSALKH